MNNDKVLHFYSVFWFWKIESHYKFNYAKYQVSQLNYGLIVNNHFEGIKYRIYRNEWAHVHPWNFIAIGTRILLQLV